MAYTAGNFDAAHFYLQWGGTLPGGEEWSCGLRMMNTAGGTPTYDAAAHTAYKNALTTFHGAVNSHICAYAAMTYCKFNVIGVDGKYADPASHEIIGIAQGGGDGATLVYPNQVALAVTLKTAVDRGPANKGRIYLPLPTMAIGGDGMITATAAGQVKTTLTTLLTSLNSYSPNIQVAVFSRKSGAATHRAVTGFGIGRVLDTQRRRRRSLVENYV